MDILCGLQGAGWGWRVGNPMAGAQNSTWPKNLSRYLEQTGRQKRLNRGYTNRPQQRRSGLGDRGALWDAGAYGGGAAGERPGCW